MDSRDVARERLDSPADAGSPEFVHRFVGLHIDTSGQVNSSQIWPFKKLKSNNFISRREWTSFFSGSNDSSLSW